jgi:predicted DNA-binding transcriptional regulator AlpA
LSASGDVGGYLAGATRSTIDALIKNDPTFPRVIQLTDRISGFDADELAKWQASRIAASHAPEKKVSRR